MTQSLAYHLVEGLFSYIRATGAPLYKRLNISAFNHACAVAMLPAQAKDKRKGEGHRYLAVINQNILMLRESYEPALDFDPTTFQKRALFDHCLDLVNIGLMGVIEDYALVDTKILAEVYAQKFGSKREI